MKNIKNHFGIKQTLTLALVVSMLVQTFIGVMPAFAATNGPRSGGTFASVDFTGAQKAWTNPGNAISSNDVWATSTLENSGNYTEYLKASNFGFSIPNGATINGISVNIERKQSCIDDKHGCTSSVTDKYVGVTKAGIVSGSNKASTDVWTTTDVVKNYGGISDMWGNTWTPADINASSFGVVLSATRDEGHNRMVYVDNINITVSYTEAVSTSATLNVIADPVAGGTVGIDGAIVATKTYDTTISSQHYAATYTENAGYTFTGWSGAGCPSGDFAKGSTEAKTCTANYTQNHYNVTYNKNGGSGSAPLDSTDYIYNQNATILGNGSLSRVGYTFAGWNTKTDGTGTNYIAGNLVSITNNLTLYAKWNINDYDVTVTVNPTIGGTVTGAGNYSYGDDFHLHATSSLGYHFVNWTGDCSGNNSTYYVHDIAADMECTANFAINQYELEYHNGLHTGGSAPADAMYGYGSTATIANQGTLIRTGYEFVGWNTKLNGSGTHYDVGATLAITHDIDLYPQWAIGQYSLSYNANGSDSGSIPALSVDYDYNEDATVLGNVNSLAKIGYNFSGWNTAADGSGTGYLSGDKITMTVDVTLYAQWIKKSYSLAYDGNGSASGTVPSISANYPFGTNVTVLGNTGSLARTGYTFAGWNAAANGSGTSYAVGSTLTIPAGDTILYAKWTINSYTITFNSNGGTPIGSKTQDYGTAITAPAAPTRTGYTFAGWSSPIPITMPAYSQTISAQWTVNNYSIFFDEAGGSTVPDITQAYGSVVTSPADPTRTGYVFAGWLPIVPVTMPAYNSTLTAQWANLLVTVTYVAGNGGTVKGASTQIINYGDDTTEVTATPSTGYVFDSWSDGITTATRSDLDVTSSKTVTANFKTSGEVKGVTTTDESEVAGATDNANCACWCSCNLFLGISWCWWILIIIIALAIIIWRVIVAYERRREEKQ